VLAAFGVPPRDRYQIVTEHPRSHMVIEDTGLGIERSDKLVVVQVISRRRKKKQKEAFYRLLCEEFERECAIPPSDVMVTMIENRDEDWSFGMGRAQFLTKQLKNNTRPPAFGPRRSIAARAASFTASVLRHY
jgi:hypothetical protein